VEQIVIVPAETAFLDRVRAPRPKRAKPRTFITRALESVPARAVQHYSRAQANQFAAAIAYFGVFSIFALLAIALAVFGFVLQGNPDLYRAAVKAVSSYVPGVLDSGTVASDTISLTALSWTAVIASVSLLLTAMGWISAFVAGIRAVALRPSSAGNPVATIAFRLLALVLLGVGVLVSAALTSLVGLVGPLFTALGIDSGVGAFFTGALGFVVGLAVDAFLAIVLFRVVGRLRFPRRIELESALISAVGVGVLKLLGSLLLSKATSNPLLASAAVIVGLLIWFNALARVVLLAVAWGTVRSVDVERSSRAAAEALERTPPAAATAPLDTRSERRLLVTSGAIIGAGVAMVAGIVGVSARDRAGRPQRR
jgi:membrane protein